MSPKRKYEISHLKNVEGHHVAAFLIEGYTDLMHRGFAPRTSSMPINWDHSVLYAHRDGEILGAMAYGKVEWKNCLYVYLGYVSPSHRRRGVYTALWKSLLKEAEKLNVRSIQSSSFIGNRDIEEFNRVNGREPIAVTYEYILSA